MDKKYRTDEKQTETRSQEIIQAFEEWASMLKGVVEYQQQQIFQNFGDIRGTLKRKVTETVDKFVDTKNIEDHKLKKVADRLVGAVTSRDARAAFQALRDLLPKR